MVLASNPSVRWRTVTFAGAILLNHEGRRFANELGRRDYVSGRIEKHCAEDQDVGCLIEVSIVA